MARRIVESERSADKKPRPESELGLTAVVVPGGSHLLRDSTTDGLPGTIRFFM
jgi:hypothetical protein